MTNPASHLRVVPAPADDPAAPDVDVVVPVYVYVDVDELEPSIRRLHGYLIDEFPFTFRITIADTASSDGTLGVALRLARELPGVEVARLAADGRGRALHAVWAASDAAVLAYTDVGLSTDLRALLPLVCVLLSGHSDVAIGTRLARSVRVERALKREVLPRSYDRLLRLVLRARFSDAQCGFKAISVDRVDDPDLRVDTVSTAFADLRGVPRLQRRLALAELPLGDVAEGIRHVAPRRHLGGSAFDPTPPAAA